MIRLALAVALAAGAALAEDEQEVTPEFGALEGSVLTHSVQRAFDSYDMPIGAFGREEKPVRRLEGEVRELVYRLDGDASTLEAVRNYQRNLEALGYEVLFECAEDECGGFDFRFGAYLVEPPAMRFDLADFRYLGASNDGSGQHVGVIASRQGGKLFVQVVSVAAEAAPISMAEITEPPQPFSKPQSGRLFALARRLTERGHAPLEGVSFQPGSADLTISSGEALAQAAKLLQGRPDLRFLVVGHTDNQGDLAANIALSQARAEAVAAALATIEGVEAAQLEAHGVGYLAPRAPNSDDDGRALNRRVELVIK